MKWIAGLVLAALYIALGALAMRRLGLFLERAQHDAAQQRQDGAVRIALENAGAERCIAAPLQAAARCAPATEVCLCFGTREEILRLLRSGELDVGVVFGGAVPAGLCAAAVPCLPAGVTGELSGNAVEPLSGTAATVVWRQPQRSECGAFLQTFVENLGAA